MMYFIHCFFFIQRSTENLKQVETFLSSTQTFYLSFSKYCEDSISDFVNIPNMAEQGGKFNFI